MFKARFTELNINEVLRLLGGGRIDIPGAELERVISCADEIKEAVEPGLVYRKVSVTAKESGADLSGLFLPGKDISGLLLPCSEAVIFAATCGYRVDRLIARMQIEDMSRAVILDACASCAVENICDNFEQDIREKLGKEGLYLTDRYSPGYGDLPVSVQKDIAEMLNTQRRIGLIVSDNQMMTPVKSVTAIMGISPVPVVLRKDKCSGCGAYENCRYRDGQCQ